MKCSHLLFVTVTVSLSSLGSFIQTSDSQGSSGSIRVTQSAGRNSNPPDSLPSEVIFPPESNRDSVEGSGHSVDSMIPQSLIHIPKELEQARNEKTSGITISTTPAFSLSELGTHDPGTDKGKTTVTGQSRSSLHVPSEEALFDGSQRATEELFAANRASMINDDFLSGGGSNEIPVKTHMFPAMTDQSLPGSGRPCAPGLSPCVVLTSFNGTNLLWDDMRRTLAFAWELHVFGSAGLFILMAVLAVFGMAGAWTLTYPLCDALALANCLLILSGTLRAVLLLLDPYGTRQILSHATLAALHNVPMHLLLWAQVTLALVTPRGLKLLLFQKKLQHPWVFGGLAITHSSLLMVADLYSPALLPVLPLLLQMVSLCWALPLCMGILAKSVSHLNMFVRSSIPQFVPSRAIEGRARRVTVVCGLLGVLCCSLQMYSLLWLYGLMGNWRRFGWGWWLSQFWARILELAWGFLLLVLGSWIFWTPSKGHSKGDHGQGRGEPSKGGQKTSFCSKVLASVQIGQLKKSEKNWENLMPNNWARYNLSKTDISKNITCPYDDQPAAFVAEYKTDPVNNSSSDSQAALLWQKVGERECVLSLIEFDMRPPSPINLRHSIDNALSLGHLVAGGLFTPPPPFWTQTVGQGSIDGENDTTLSPTYVGPQWMLDTESITTSLEYFQAKEPMQSSNATTNQSDCAESPTGGHRNKQSNLRFSAAMHQHRWSDDDVTDL